MITVLTNTTMRGLNVTGMTCGCCVRAPTDAVDPGAVVQVDLDAGRVMVRDETAPASRLAQAIIAEGYAAEPAEA